MHRTLRPLALLLLSGLASSACQAPDVGDGPAARSTPRGEPGPRVEWGMVIHGGAGTIARESMTPEREAAFRGSLEAALRAGHEVLAGGGDALDAVVAAVRLMEDDSLFNAGRGAVFTHDGRNELDAAIMDGPTRRAGAVAGVTTVRNPIVLARTVMEQSEHVFLIGQGAEAFARAHGVEEVPTSYFHTGHRWEALQRARAEETRTEQPSEAGPRHPPPPDHPPQVDPADSRRGGSDPRHRFGTVGAVALDQRGRLAAATSTGGMTNKRWGRVGDVPVIGAGTWAGPRCAVSGTGWGEYFIMNTVARDVCARFEFGNVTLQRAAEEVIHMVLPPQAEDTGGVIALSADGEIVWAFNTPGMYRGRIDQDGNVVLGIYREDG